MFHITQVEILGFWGKYRVATDFHPDVNIFIGKNGTGKTTFLNLLQAVLRADLSAIMSLEFKKVTVTLKSNSEIKTISVLKKSEPALPFETARFNIEQTSYDLPIYPREIELIISRQRKTSFSENYNNLRQALGEVINISTFFSYKCIPETRHEEYYPAFPYQNRAAIDYRLENIVHQLTEYQLSLADKSNALASNLQQEIYNSILQHESDNEISPLHISEMMQDMATSLLEAENKKETIYQPISIFTNLICHLMQDKDFAITNYGKIVIRKDEHDLSVFDLSSGEKQLLILLSEPLLQRQEPFIFIADEPELSLHIEWQAEIISSIREINSLSQVIVATHSPEIAGGWAEKIIDMKDIIYVQRMLLR